MKLNRREFLKGLLVAGIAAALLPMDTNGAPSPEKERNVCQNINNIPKEIAQLMRENVDCYSLQAAIERESLLILDNAGIDTTKLPAGFWRPTFACGGYIYNPERVFYPDGVKIMKTLTNSRDRDR